MPTTWLSQEEQLRGSDRVVEQRGEAVAFVAQSMGGVPLVLVARETLPDSTESKSDFPPEVRQLLE